MLNKLAQDIVAYRKEKGFHTGWDNMDQKLLLVIGEIIEAHEDMRDGKLAKYYTESIDKDGNKRLKPCGFASELADAAIRLLDIIGSVEIDGQKIDFESEVEEKMSYNLARPYMHGKKF